MMSDDPMAEFVLDKVTDVSVQAARAFASSGADILHMGDDIGMQHSIMMSVELFSTWLLPRITRVIQAAKAIKPDILVFFHSCGYIKPFIPLLIKAGVDILNPIQPECMDFANIHQEFGDALSFHGTIGTQSTMPYGTADDVRREVMKNLETAGGKGGLFAAPTHLLEPEVPWQNIVAYMEACRDFTR
jgi:uroporphyrinogen decarboxylase